MQGIPHHLLDVTDPMVVYSASDFVKDANAAITDIISRSNVPLIAGGTFFYIELLRGNMSPAPVAPDQTYRDSLQDFSTAELFTQLQERDPRRAAIIDADNRHRLIRALEIINTLGVVPPVSKVESNYDWLVLGVDVEKEVFHKNIHDRLYERLDQGLIEEVSGLLAQGVSAQRLEDLGLEYRYVSKFLQGELTKDEMIPLLETKIKQYAKRQMTWLKRDTDIVWVDPRDKTAIYDQINQFLQ
jgi:tRNA dimethylallyltransferase